MNGAVVVVAAALGLLWIGLLWIGCAILEARINRLKDRIDRLERR